MAANPGSSPPVEQPAEAIEAAPHEVRPAVVRSGSWSGVALPSRLSFAEQTQGSGLTMSYSTGIRRPD